MLLPQSIYRRIPLFWMTLGILFLFLGLIAGRQYAQFPLYLGVGLLCIARALWIYQARWKYFRRNEIETMRSTQIIDRPKEPPKP
jgi:hypothetical protein